MLCYEVTSQYLIAFIFENVIEKKGQSFGQLDYWDLCLQ